jgi:exopolysaccharide production protein ExoQ
MNPSLATFIYWCGIAGLFYLDRDKAARPSKALWLPIIWIAIVSSRSVSEWFGLTPTGSNVQLQGSPLDAAVFGVLEAVAIGVLIRRSRRTRTLLLANLPILIYFVYCLASVTWSYHPDVAFKRWFKAIGDLIMVLVIVTDPEPLDALRLLISRLGFVLLPASLLLMKYYPALGRGFNPDGVPENTGVTTNKNTLGVVLLVISLGTLWRILSLLRDKDRPDRRRHLIAQITLFAFGVVLLEMANSQTSIACFMLGAVIVLATNLRALQRRPARVHVLCLSIVLTGAVLIYGGQAQVAHALGRQATLSGRTEIWAVLIPTVPSSMVGAGFESYWISPSIAAVWRNLSNQGWWHPELLVTEAHNGYIEVFLNLGWAGVCLIAGILVSGYARAIKGYRRNPSIAALMLAYIIASAAYSFTEAGFRMLDPMWIFLLLAVVSSTGLASGFFRGEAPKSLASRGGTSTKTRASNQFVPASEHIYAAQSGLIRSRTISANSIW